MLVSEVTSLRASTAAAVEAMNFITALDRSFDRRQRIADVGRDVVQGDDFPGDRIGHAHVASCLKARLEQWGIKPANPYPLSGQLDLYQCAGTAFAHHFL
jgi:hypothetical protein